MTIKTSFIVLQLILGTEFSIGKPNNKILAQGLAWKWLDKVPWVWLSIKRPIDDHPKRKEIKNTGHVAHKKMLFIIPFEISSCRGICFCRLQEKKVLLYGLLKWLGFHRVFCTAGIAIWTPILQYMGVIKISLNNGQQQWKALCQRCISAELWNKRWFLVKNRCKHAVLFPVLYM